MVCGEHQGQTMLDDIISYEHGELSEQQTIELFQRIVNNGMVWTMKGDYSRKAMELERKGLIRFPRTKLFNRLTAEQKERVEALEITAQSLAHVLTELSDLQANRIVSAQLSSLESTTLVRVKEFFKTIQDRVLGEKESIVAG